MNVLCYHEAKIGLQKTAYAQMSAEVLGYAGTSRRVMAIRL